MLYLIPSSKVRNAIEELHGLEVLWAFAWEVEILGLLQAPSFD
jgi:hypothetical protein